MVGTEYLRNVALAYVVKQLSYSSQSSVIERCEKEDTGGGTKSWSVPENLFLYSKNFHTQ